MKKKEKDATITLRISEDFKNQIQAKATLSRRSMTQLIIDALIDYMKK